jgi:hypothetical protein
MKQSKELQYQREINNNVSKKSKKRQRQKDSKKPTLPH